MRRIYPNTDIHININLNNYTIQDGDIVGDLTFRFYTTDSNNYILKTKEDIKKGVLTLYANEIKILNEGALKYDYKCGQFYKNECLTDYYIVNPLVWGDIEGNIANQKDLIELITKIARDEIRKSKQN